MGYSPAMGMRFEDALLSMRHRMKTAEVRLYMLARGWLAYPVTPAHIATAEERLYTLARGWLAYPVTPCAHIATAEERLYKHTVANALQNGSPPKTKFPTAKPQPETV